MGRLAEFVKQVRRERVGAQIPGFDPRDGGIHARALFLLEAPGPKAVSTGFISRDNPDPSARNMRALLHEAGLRREDTVLWNVVPWYVGIPGKIRPISKEDLKQARPYRSKLLELLKALTVVVLVGRKAQAIEEELQGRFFVLRKTFHPSNQVRNRWPKKYATIKATFSEVAKLIS